MEQNNLKSYEVGAVKLSTIKKSKARRERPFIAQEWVVQDS